MRKILVTGPIASGKSAVCRHLAESGFEVYDSDSRAKALYDEIPGLKDRVERVLGVPFSRISVIFTDDVKRQALEDLLYPLVLEDIRRWMGECSGETVFIESAVAPRSRVFDGFFDAVWMVDAPYELRLARNPKVAARNAVQNFEGFEPDERIINDGTPAELIMKTDILIKKTI
ncbi:MAG: dephospho-CoA kinase [Bacteroidales bacterium]|nr:dephospho-CoA kinase [Bacteroidales bacterium]